MLDQAPVTTMLPVIALNRARHFYETKLGLRPLARRQVQICLR
jgi:catechol 2,3-dioxygenase-like lactoylglutathione lyase family enzyme